MAQQKYSICPSGRKLPGVRLLRRSVLWCTWGNTTPLAKHGRYLTRPFGPEQVCHGWLYFVIYKSIGSRPVLLECMGAKYRESTPSTSPATSIANLFLNIFEEDEIIEQFKDFTPFLKRFIDDECGTFGNPILT